MSKKRGSVKKVVLLGGGGRGGGGGVEARPQLSAKKVQVFFCFHSIQNPSKRENTQKKLFGCTPPPPNQPNPCVLVAYLHTHSVSSACNRSSFDRGSLGRYSTYVSV